ncbi:hypothetical protein GCM10020218_018330 [Dactylosporangium vinaceum]
MHTYRGADSDARLATVGRLAGELGITGTQLVLAWMLHQESPRRVALIGPRTPAQYESTAVGLDVKLDATVLETLDAAGA